MINHPAKKIIFLITAILLVLACEVPSLPGAVAPNPTLDIGTIIAGTAAAAQMQTLTALPPTTTFTPTLPPTKTPSDIPTSTPTILLIYSTKTYTPSPPPPESVGGGCVLLAQEPANDTVIGRKINFETFWTIKNTGQNSWLDTNVDFRYQSGTDMNKRDALDLPYSVGVESEVTLKVSMKSPEKPGSYTTKWVLTSGKTTLCKLFLRIIVQ